MDNFYLIIDYENILQTLQLMKEKKSLRNILSNESMLFA